MENWKIGSQGSQKAPEFWFENYKKQFGEKLIFQYFLCKNLEFGHAKLEISTQKSIKKPSGIKPEKK